jgi:hypothetical protein
MRLCGVGLWRARTSWGLRPTRPGLALGSVLAPPRTVGCSRLLGCLVCTCREGRPGVGRPWLRSLEGEVGFVEGRGVPDDGGVVGVAVVGFDVADGVALVEEVAVGAVVVEVGGDGSVGEVCHLSDPFLLQPNC